MAMQRRQSWHKDDFYSKSSLNGHAGVYFNIKGCGPKIDIDVFEEPENQISLADDKASKQMISIQSCLYMVMQECILMLRVRAQKSIKKFLKNPKF